MAHQAQFDFVHSVKNRYPDMFGGRTKVLEVGSLNINGTIRNLFSTSFYIGIDLELGPGVDLAAPGHTVLFADRFFDLSISCECFEHNPYWVETFLNMVRMTDKMVVFTCATTDRPEHGTTRTSEAESPFTTGIWDYYQNLTEDDFKEYIELEKHFAFYEFTSNETAHDLYFWGIRK
jgi:hypothetical protein